MCVFYPLLTISTTFALFEFIVCLCFHPIYSHFHTGHDLDDLDHL